MCVVISTVGYRVDIIATTLFQQFDWSLQLLDWSNDTCMKDFSGGHNLESLNRRNGMYQRFNLRGFPHHHTLHKLEQTFVVQNLKVSFFALGPVSHSLHLTTL